MQDSDPKIDQHQYIDIQPIQNFPEKLKYIDSKQIQQYRRKYIREKKYMVLSYFPLFD